MDLSDPLTVAALFIGGIFVGVSVIALYIKIRYR
jgi:heme/copper-type cytochrome/quinol oxidase subunit 2